MRKQKYSELFKDLPDCAAEYIRLVIQKMRYRKKVRAEVAEELAHHFEDRLERCATEQDREQAARELIAEFGDAALLGKLLRRAKKRCRPLWRTAVVRTFQGTGILFLGFIIYTSWFITGKPTIAIDYLNRINEMNQPKVLDKENAWTYYKKAFESYIEPPDMIDIQSIVSYKNTAGAYQKYLSLDQKEKDELKNWLRQNQPAWNQFVDGSKKPYYYKEQTYGQNNDERWLISILVPHLNSFQKFRRLGIISSCVKFEQNHPLDSLADCMPLIRAGKHLQEQEFSIVEYLVGISLSRHAHTQIFLILKHEEISSNRLLAIQKQLQGLYQDFPMLNLKGEKYMFLDTIQHLFTNSGPGGGHLIPRHISEFRDLLGDDFLFGEHDPFKGIGYIAAGMLHARRDETIQKADRIYDKLTEILKMTPYQRKKADIDEDEILLSIPQYRHFLLRYFTPAVGRISKMSFQVKTLHEAVILVLALKRYQLEHDQYPDSLQVLLEDGYIDHIPDDPFSDGPIVYRKTEDDFILYSVGQDFEDNSGAPGKDRSGKPIIWGETGDAVFWPVEDRDS